MFMHDLGTGARARYASLLDALTHNGRPDDVEKFFTDWELLLADVHETHVSYPVLAFFPSHRDDRSWLNGLDEVVTAADFVSAAIHPSQCLPAERLTMGAASTVADLRRQLFVPEAHVDTGDIELPATEHQIALRLQSMDALVPPPTPQHVEDSFRNKQAETIGQLLPLQALLGAPAR